MKGTIKLTLELKKRLLEAIAAGTLDLSIFEGVADDLDERSEREIIEEMVRIEKLFYPEKLAPLMLKWAKHEITDAEYIAARLELHC